MPLSENSKSVAVGGRRDVAADGGDMGDVSQLVANGAQTLLVSSGENEIPAATGERAGERESESAGGTGDKCGALLLPGLHVLLVECPSLRAMYKFK